MPKFPTNKTTDSTTVSTCGGFIRMSDGAVFRRTVLNRGEMKTDADTAMVEKGLDELDAITVQEA